MAAAAVKAPSFGAAAGRSDDFGGPGYISPLSYGNNSSSIPNTTILNNKLGIFSSTKPVVHDEDRIASPAAPASPKSSTKQSQYKLRPTLRNLDTKMSSRTMTVPMSAGTAATKRSDSRLHKRASSGSSLPGSPQAVLAAAHAQMTTPISPYEEPFPDITPTTSSTPKIKPYLRKISTGKDDAEQGRLDLSKSVSNENGALAGLGIEDFGVRSVSDGVTMTSGRRTSHVRNTSAGSQASTASGSFRPTLPFIHPMRPTPTRPYTPPVAADASSMDDEEAHESSDVVPEDDVQPNPTMQRTARSMSLSSTPQVLQSSAPTPLSQSHTAADLGHVPKLTSTTNMNNASQTNLSIRSGKSQKSLSSRSKSQSKSNLTTYRPRAETNRSVELLPATTRTSSRTSLDRAISFVSRRSDPDPTTRDERIRAARRKFEAKEADKDRKMERQEVKRRESDIAKRTKKEERQRRKSELSVSDKMPGGERPRAGSSASKMKKSAREKGGEVGELKTRRYDESEITALPTHGVEPGKSETKECDASLGRSDSRTGRWSRFSVWFQTRALSCGRKRP